MGEGKHYGLHKAYSADITGRDLVYGHADENTKDTVMILHIKQLSSGNNYRFYKKNAEGKKHFIIEVYAHCIIGPPHATWQNLSFFIKHFDPFLNRRLNGYRWKFNSQTEAEQLLSLAILKGWL